MKLFCDRKDVEYHPASGLNLFPGIHDYPDDRTAQLVAAGLKKVDPLKAKRAAAEKAARDLEELETLEGSNVNGEE